MLEHTKISYQCIESTFDRSPNRTSYWQDIRRKHLVLSALFTPCLGSAQRWTGTRSYHVCQVARGTTPSELLLKSLYIHFILYHGSGYPSCPPQTACKTALTSLPGMVTSVRPEMVYFIRVADLAFLRSTNDTWRKTDNSSSPYLLEEENRSSKL